MTDRRVRRATSDDALAVRRLVDGALLEVGDVESRIDDGDVLVATEPRSVGTGETRRVLGAVVLETPVRGETKGHTSRRSPSTDVTADVGSEPTCSRRRSSKRAC
ncbi:hypothetical protein ACFQS4_14470 [Saliphagus sp. GCM10025317]